MTGRRRVVVGSALVLLMVATGIWVMGRARPGAPLSFPPPPPPPQSPVSFSDFTGSGACAECHGEQYDQWARSTHGRAGGPADPTVILAPFDGTPIRFLDATVIPSVDGNGEYGFTVYQDEFPPFRFVVSGVIGGGHMVGGGTQGFVSGYPDGTVRFLPFDYSRTDDTWFCNTDTRTMAGWVPITEEMRLADCGDWPPNRVLGASDRHSNCQECHGSQINLEFDRHAGRYDTRIVSLGINCESCHGPGREHVARARSGGFAGTDLAIQTFFNVDKDASLEVCFRCHALKNELHEGYLPGRDLESHYALKTLAIGEEPLFPDGRVRTFAYQGNHLASDCYLSGSMTCIDCHEPHGQAYQDVFGGPLVGRFDDGQCLSCHPSKADDIPGHTGHALRSPGSNCVACHMPFLQHPEIGSGVRFARSDHTIPIPRPGFDDRMGITSACRQCHEDRPADELEAVARDWWGEMKPHKDIVTALFESDGMTDRMDAVDRLLNPDQPFPMALVGAIGRFTTRFLRPDATVEEAVIAALRRLSAHADVDVRASALAALHLAAGSDPEVKRTLIDRISSDERDRAVRDRWVTVLGSWADGYREEGDLAAAITVYRKALEVLPEHTGILLSLGAAYRAVPNPTAAIETFQRSLAIDPDQPMTLVNLGIAFDMVSRADEAADAFRRALTIDPNEALAEFNLGNYHLRRSEFEEAARRYEAAARLDPALALAHFYLARAYIGLDQLASALPAARRAVEFDPDNENARQLLRDLEQVVGEAN